MDQDIKDDPDWERRHFRANDKTFLAYLDVGKLDGKPLIFLHGFTGSSEVWKRNIPFFTSNGFRVIAPDLRGHGESTRTTSGYHVARLAMDLKELIDCVQPQGKIMCVAGSLGCAILWSYAELFTPAAFSHMVWVDQAPLQNYEADGSWGPDHGNRSCNSASALANLQATLKYQPDDAFTGTIASCLAYRSHPHPSDNVTNSMADEDEAFFLDIAHQGDPTWLGKLMADHTSLDWRDSIPMTFGGTNGCNVKILVVASERSGCFPSAGPLSVCKGINLRRKLASESDTTNQIPLALGGSIDWGGHWCYYEQPDTFNELVMEFLSDMSNHHTLPKFFLKTQWL